MSERDEARSGAGREPTHGRVGPADPHADPPTDPALRRPEVPPAEPDTVSLPTPPGSAPPGPTPSGPTPSGSTQSDATVGRTRTSGLYVGLILFTLVLILLLVFILQNLHSVEINFLGLSGQLPTGVALLLAAIAGALLVAIPGTGRIVQLRRAARRGGR
jgi:uncharacterized integral membrane protein